MHDTFEARNGLEEKLPAAQEGMLPGDGFLQCLTDTRVSMPVRDSIGIAGVTAGDEAVPLSVKARDGIEIPVLSASPERAGSFRDDYPDFEGGLLAGFRRVLARAGSGIGISINPGWPVGMALEPGMVLQLKHN